VRVTIRFFGGRRCVFVIGHCVSFLFVGFPRGFDCSGGHVRPILSSRSNGGVFRRRTGRTASRVSAKFNWMLERELTGLRYSYEEAGPSWTLVPPKKLPARTHAQGRYFREARLSVVSDKPAPRPQGETIRCPLSGVKQTCRLHCGMSAFDPKRTFGLIVTRRPASQSVRLQPL
jgi:hypothetical protein